MSSLSRASLTGVLAGSMPWSISTSALTGAAPSVGAETILTWFGFGFGFGFGIGFGFGFGFGFGIGFGFGFGFGFGSGSGLG